MRRKSSVKGGSIEPEQQLELIDAAAKWGGQPGERVLLETAGYDLELGDELGMSIVRHLDRAGKNQWVDFCRALALTSQWTTNHSELFFRQITLAILVESLRATNFWSTDWEPADDLTACVAKIEGLLDIRLRLQPPTGDVKLWELDGAQRQAWRGKAVPRDPPLLHIVKRPIMIIGYEEGLRYLGAPSIELQENCKSTQSAIWVRRGFVWDFDRQPDSCIEWPQDLQVPSSNTPEFREGIASVLLRHLDSDLSAKFRNPDVNGGTR